MIPKVCSRLRKRSRSNKEHDPEKCAAAFGKGHAQTKSMTPKSVQRFPEKIMLKQSMIPKSAQPLSEKIMLKQRAKAGCDAKKCHPP
jgi:hypothetical protein